jgi:helix-turn-helix protein
VSVQAVRWAAEQTTGSPMSKLVLYALAEHANTTGHCHPSLSTLATETEASTSTVKRALSALTEARLISRTPRTRGTGATTSTGYTLALHRSDSTPGTSAAEVTPSQGAAHGEPGTGSERATPRLTVSPYARSTVSYQGEPPVEPTTEPSRYGRVRTSGTATPADLAATAVRPDAYRLVAAWRERTGAAYRPTTVRALAKHADTVLRDGGNAEALQAALDEWDRRPDARPGLLPHLYDDAIKAARLAEQPAARSAPRSARGDKVRGWLALAEQADDQAASVEHLAVEAGRS